MSMTKRDFEAFAARFRADLAEADGPDWRSVSYAVAAFIAVARTLNPRFDAARFRAAVYWPEADPDAFSRDRDDPNFDDPKWSEA